jgi:hypothetical protein
MRILFRALTLAVLALFSSAAWTFDIELPGGAKLCDDKGGLFGCSRPPGADEVDGVALEIWINASHNSAAGGALPIPQNIRQFLTGYASDASMNSVRYKIGDNGVANAAGVIERGGHVSAVTLIDVIVFLGPSEANDVALWAHELTHVDQYRDWGTKSFAVQYASDYNSVEAPAYAKGNGFRQWASPNLVPGWGVWCYEPGGGVLGRLPAAKQLGSPCQTIFGAGATGSSPFG